MPDRPTSPWIPTPPAAPDAAAPSDPAAPPTNPWALPRPASPVVEAVQDSMTQAPEEAAAAPVDAGVPEADAPGSAEAEAPAAEPDVAAPAAEAPPAEPAPEPVAADIPPPSWTPEPARRRGEGATGLLAALRRELLIPVWLTALGAAALVAAAVACVVLAGQDDTPAPSTATAPSAVGLEASAPRLRTLREPFQLDGVRWAVFLSPSQDWTRFRAQVLPGPGRRWVLIAVRVRNLARDSFVPNGLGYRLADDSGTEYTPDPGHSTDGAAGPAVPKNGLGQVQLAFKVPLAATGLTLRYATRVPGGTAVGVPIGTG